MNSPQLEYFLARLYTDARLLAQFLQDPAATASKAGLSAEEVRAMSQIDKAGLQLAADSFKRKREGGKISFIQRLARLALRRKK